MSRLRNGTSRIEVMPLGLNSELTKIYEIRVFYGRHSIILRSSPKVLFPSHEEKSHLPLSMLHTSFRFESYT